MNRTDVCEGWKALGLFCGDAMTLQPYNWRFVINNVFEK